MSRVSIRIALILASIAAAGLLLGAVILSPIGTGILLPYLAQRAEAGGDLTLDIAQVDGALWGDVTLRGVDANLEDGTSLSIERLTFGIDLLPLLNRNIRLEPLSLAGVRLRLPLQQGRTDTTIATSPPEEQSSWRVEVSGLELSNSHVTVAGASWLDMLPEMEALDTTGDGSLRLSDVRLGSSRFTASIGETSSVDMTLSDLEGLLAPFEFSLGGVDLSAEPESGRLRLQATGGSVRDRQNRGTIEADVQFETEPERGWTALDVDARLSAVAVEWIPNADSLFPGGQLHGDVRTSGGQESLEVTADLRLASEAAEDANQPTLTTRGMVSLRDTISFDSLRVSASTSLTLLRRWMEEQYLPEGTVSVEAVVDGPITRANLVGSLVRRTGHASGAADTIDFSLAPSLRMGDNREDTASARLPIDSLRYRVAYRGRPGEARIEGNFRTSDSVWYFDDIRLGTTELNIQSLFESAPSTVMSAAGSGRVRMVGGVIENATLQVTLDSAEVEGNRLSAAVSGTYAPNQWAIDTLGVNGPGFTLYGYGRLGADRADADSIVLTGDIESVEEVSSFVAAALQREMPFDTVPAGMLRLTSSIKGSPSAPRIAFDARADQFTIAGFTVEEATANGNLDRSLHGTISAELKSVVGAGRALDHFSLRLAGGTDSASAGFDALLGSASFVGGFRYDSVAGGHQITVDSLRAIVTGNTWNVRPGAVLIADSENLQVDSLVLQGSPGRIVVAGGASSNDSSRLDVALEDISISSLEALIGGDTVTSAAGSLSGNMILEGPLSAPTGRADLFAHSTSLDGQELSDAELSLVVSTRQTDVRLALAGDSSLRVSGTVPLSLQTSPFGASLDETGPLDITVTVEGAELSGLKPLLANVEEPSGQIFADIAIAGTWNEPALSGNVALRWGQMYVPSLGVEYAGIELAATLEGTRAQIDSLLLLTAQGRLRASGTVDFAPLDDPTLDVAVNATQFQAIDDPQFLRMRTSGDLEIGGRLRAPMVTGQLTANRAVLRFADIVEKDVVNLDSPLFAGVVDTTVLRREGLEPGLMQRVQDSLALDSLVVKLGSDVWLRSDEANVQLGGEAAVSKTADSYRVFGTFVPRRGTYQLSLGPAATREFRITGGSVRFFGNPETDASVDIDASHTVRTFRGERVDVYANISGTLAEPTVELSSSLGSQVSDSEIISYLLFGAPSVQVFAGRRGREDQSVFRRSAQQMANFLSGTLEQSLTGSLGIPLDYLRINPGDVNEGFSSTEIQVGKQLDLFGRPAFLTASPRLCPDQGLISFKTLGASLEAWLADDWLAAASIDRVGGCEFSGLTRSSYSVGVDLFWEKH